MTTNHNKSAGTGRYSDNRCSDG